MATGFTSSSNTYFSNSCYITASSDTSGALVCTGVGNYGNTQGYSSINVSSEIATAPNWYGQTDLVVAAYAGRFYYTPSAAVLTLSSSSWNVGCSGITWVSINSANYTYYDSWGGDWHLNFDWIEIGNASAGTSISCSASLTITTTNGSTLDYNPPGSFSIEFFGA